PLGGGRRSRSPATRRRPPGCPCSPPATLGSSRASREPRTPPPPVPPPPGGRWSLAVLVGEHGALRVGHRLGRWLWIGGAIGVGERLPGGFGSDRSLRIRDGAL